MKDVNGNEEEKQEKKRAVSLPDMETIDNFWSNILAVTINMFEKIMIVGGKDAGNVLIMYMRYMLIAKMQKTNQVYATNSFMAKGLTWDIGKVKKYKSILMANEIILTVQRRNKNGTFGKQYLRILGMGRKVDKVDNRRVDYPPAGKNRPPVNYPTSALTQESKMLKLKNKTVVRIIKTFEINEVIVNLAVAKIGEGNVIDLLESIEAYNEKEKVKCATALFRTLVDRKLEQLTGEKVSRNKKDNTCQN